MVARDAIEILGMIERQGVRIWLDGGWAADALLGRQTRHHWDLDIVIEQKDVNAVVGMLQIRGYRPKPQNNPRPWNFALYNGPRREVDFHVVVLDEQGNGICGPPAGGRFYPAASLTGIGAIRGKVFRCVTRA